MSIPLPPVPATPQAPLAGLAELVRKNLPGVPFEAAATATDTDLHVAPEHLLALITGLKTRRELAFDYLRNIAGIDNQAEGLAVKYHLYSFRFGHALQITATCTPLNAHVPSITGLYDAANWHEREAAEMFGLVFDGHPNPKNLLLEEDLRIHPLLKAHPLQAAEILQGIEEGPPGFKF
ncbi:MAG: NADH-quinone oxidoreductase subunit C [Tepidiformaceae bacterium]